MLSEIDSIRSASDYSVVYLVILKPNPVHSRLLTFFKLIKIIFPTRKNMITFSYPRSWQKALHITSLCGCEGMREVFNEIMDNSDVVMRCPLIHSYIVTRGLLISSDGSKPYEKSLLLLLHPSHKDTFVEVEDIILSYPIWHPLPKFLNHLYFLANEPLKTDKVELGLCYPLFTPWRWSVLLIITNTRNMSAN